MCLRQNLRLDIDRPIHKLKKRLATPVVTCGSLDARIFYPFSCTTSCNIVLLEMTQVMTKRPRRQVSCFTHISYDSWNDIATFLQRYDLEAIQLVGEDLRNLAAKHVAQLPPRVTCELTLSLSHITLIATDESRFMEDIIVPSTSSYSSKLAAFAERSRNVAVDQVTVYSSVFATSGFGILARTFPNLRQATTLTGMLLRETDQH